MLENKNKLKQGIAVLLFGLILIMPNFILAQSSVTISVSDDEINDLQDEIREKQKKIDDLNRQREQYERTLSTTRKQINSLQGQIGNLNTVISKLNIEVQTIELEIEEVNLQIKNLKYLQENNNEQIEQEKEKISEIIKTLNRNSYSSDFFSLVLKNKSLADFFAKLSELNKLSASLKQSLNELTDKNIELKRQQNLLLQKNEQLEELNTKLKANQEKISNEKSVKDNLLTTTKGQEDKYASLIAELKAEQNAINAEIYNLEIETRKKLLELKGEEFLASEKGFIWPVPSRRVTAYFHDPDYPYRHIFEHPAIDIGSTPQGTAIRAIKSGYVAKVRDTGNSGGYNYLMLIHSDGLSSVYGHLSRMVVEEDSFVVQGEIIAYSGGNPGTAGAGRLTTGAHLHLEIRKNGIPVNPLNYLP